MTLQFHKMQISCDAIVCAYYEFHHYPGELEEVGCMVAGELEEVGCRVHRYPGELEEVGCRVHRYPGELEEVGCSYPGELEEVGRRGAPLPC